MSHLSPIGLDVCPFAAAMKEVSPWVTFPGATSDISTAKASDPGGRTLRFDRGIGSLRSAGPCQSSLCRNGADHMALRRVRARRDRIAVMPFELEIPVEAWVAGKLQREIGDGDRIVDHDMTNAHTVHSDRPPCIDVFSQRPQQSLIGSQPDFDLAEAILDTWNRSP